MNCSACNAPIPADAAFCPKCGAKAPTTYAPAATAQEALRQKIAEARSGAADPEVSLWKGSYSPKAMVGYWILAAIITAVAFAAAFLSAQGAAAFFIAFIVSVAIWFGVAVQLLYQRYSVDYELTTQRLIHRRGILRRVSSRIEVIDVDDVQVEQGFIERMLGVGTIKLLSSDISDPTLTMHGIDGVGAIATMIDNTRRDERRKRGLHIETV